MLAVPATEEKVKLVALSIRKEDVIGSKCYLQGAFQKKREGLPIGFS